MGRSPIRQPPRSGMNASPRRCSNGPQNRIGMRLEPACASMSETCALSTLVGSRTSSPSSGPPLTWTPCSSSSPDTIRTSAISGTPRRRLTPSPRREATIALDTRFLAPRTVTSPCRGFPPWTVNASLMPPSMTNERAGTHQQVPARWPCRGSASGLLGGALGRGALGRGLRRRPRGGPGCGLGRGPARGGLRGGLARGRALRRAPGGALRRGLRRSRGGRGVLGGRLARRLGGGLGSRGLLCGAAGGGGGRCLGAVLRRGLLGGATRRRRLRRLGSRLARATGRRRGRLGLSGGGLLRRATAPSRRGRSGGRRVARRRTSRARCRARGCGGAGGDGRSEGPQRLGVGGDLLERRTGPEPWHRGLLDFHGLPGAWVAPGARRPCGLLERAEARDGDLLALGDRDGDGVDDGLERLGGGPLAAESRLESFDQLSLVHCGSPPEVVAGLSAQAGRAVERRPTRDRR